MSLLMNSSQAKAEESPALTGLQALQTAISGHLQNSLMSLGNVGKPIETFSAEIQSVLEMAMNSYNTFTTS